MARYLWSGTVSFGLVAIPVHLAPAVREQRVAFHLLHNEDGARLKRRMFCPKEEHFIHPEHIVKGFEVDTDTYVVVREDEFEALVPADELIPQEVSVARKKLKSVRDAVKEMKAPFDPDQYPDTYREKSLEQARRQ